MRPIDGSNWCWCASCDCFGSTGAYFAFGDTYYCAGCIDQARDQAAQQLDYAAA